jgi:hypothetical protein
MFTDHHIRSDLARMHVDELIARADAERRARPARPLCARPARRLAALRLLARGLRVEREIQFDVARVPKA